MSTRHGRSSASVVGAVGAVVRSAVATVLRTAARLGCGRPQSFTTIPRIVFRFFGQFFF